MRSSRRAFVAAGLAGGFVMPAIGTGKANAAEFRYKVGNQTSPTHACTVWLQKAAADILAQSGGRVDIKVYSGGQLGGMPDMISQLRSGALEMLMVAGQLSTFVPEVSLFGIGYAFAGYDQVWAAMDGDLGSYLKDKIRERRLHVFDKQWDNGFRQVTSSAKPIKAAEDLKGLKIRVPVAPLYVDVFNLLGALPTVVDAAEMYTALQAKVVVAQENALPIIEAFKLHEVQRYCSMTNHIWDGFFMIASRTAWAGLPPDLQEIVSRNLDAAALSQRTDIATSTDAIRHRLEGLGMAFNQPETSSFRETLARAGFYTKWRSRFERPGWDALEKYSGALS